MPNGTPWRLSGHKAELHADTLRGELDLDQPRRGLFNLRAFDHPIDGRLWGWRVDEGWRVDDEAQAGAASRSTDSGQEPQRLREAYVRGDDLVLTYQPTRDRPFEVQLYWRHEAQPTQPPETSAAQNQAARLSLIVSIRTPLLETEPVVAVSSVRGGFTTELTNNGSAVEQRPQSNGPAVIEACHPDDQTELTRGDEPGAIEWRLFSHFLEKGVIRRARLTLAIGPDAAALDQAYKAFLDEPLPLTT